MNRLAFLTVLSAAACSAMAGGVTGSGMVVLDNTASGALSMTGNSTVIIPTRAVYVNSSSTSAVRTVGNASLDTPDLYICGTASFSGGSGCTGMVHPSCVPYADPLVNTSFPSPSGLTDHAAVSIGAGQNVALSPGYYSHGISITGNSNVVLNPGVYLVKNQFKITSGSISGQGVCIVMLDGSMSIAGASSLVLSPAADGAMPNIVICQPSSNSNGMSLAGGSGVNISGSIYAPGATLSLVGNSSLAGDGPQMGDLVVAKKVSLAGTGSVKIGRPEFAAIVLPHLPLAD